ncbi:hypothetical protein C8J57DRAFT_1506165 [Mycena rebaudengoi]|nr:hypothetical protein C8J57DRAFT_1506165 [Mycena rebaudengoi]
MATLKFDSEYWETSLPDIQKLPSEDKLHLILSLVIFLGVSIRALLVFIFETNILALREMITPLAHAIVLDESDSIITDPSLKICIKDLTIARMCELMQPGVLARKYQCSAPFLYGLLHTFTASPNRYCRRKKDKEDKGKAKESESSFDSMPAPKTAAAAAESAADSDWDDDPDVD